VKDPFSLYYLEKDKSDTLFSSFEFIRRLAFDAYVFNNYHSLYPVSFLYFLYKLDQILSVKIFGNSINLVCQFRYLKDNILSVLSISFYMITNQFKLGNSQYKLAL